VVGRGDSICGYENKERRGNAAKNKETWVQAEKNKEIIFVFTVVKKDFPISTYERKGISFNTFNISKDILQNHNPYFLYCYYADCF
jgi:hypothetical protein